MTGARIVRVSLPFSFSDQSGFRRGLSFATVLVVRDTNSLRLILFSENCGHFPVEVTEEADREAVEKNKL